MKNSPFIFERYDFDRKTATLTLRYAYEDGAQFVEAITFPPITREISTADNAALDTLFRLVFLLAGVSYYKAYAPEQLQCKAFALDSATAAFVEKVYRHGLGEFAYKNQLDLRERLQFSVENVAPPAPVSLRLSDRLCVPVGGGKDSIVTIECLKQAQFPISLFALSTPAGVAAPIQSTVDISGLPFVNVTRALSGTLLELNKADAYNGHVPITAILSAIAIAAAVMQGFGAVVMSNEHSASAPNHLEINHQYSKSLSFERDFAHYIAAHISPDIAYFSFLRPLSETEILRRFARLEKYHSIFRSCNTAFRQDDKQRNKNWCCNCPKCRFIFLGLAPFVAKQHLVSIFGKNLLDDAAQEQGFAELCGLHAHKPFECVGEIEESALLLEKLKHHPDWQHDAVVQKLGARLPPTADFDKKFNTLFEIHADHNVPDNFMKAFHACR